MIVMTLLETIEYVHYHILLGRLSSSMTVLVCRRSSASIYPPLPAIIMLH